MLKINEQAPLDISLNNGLGESVSLRDMLGSFIVLYAYPKDDTPGCVKEACSIRDVYQEFKDLGVKIIGISPDDPISHQKFTKKYDLPFSLWVDTEHTLLTALGVWGEKSFMGKSYSGVARTTFLIDPTGTIIHVWENVKPEGHGEAVLDFVKNLNIGNNF